MSLDPRLVRVVMEAGTSDVKEIAARLRMTGYVRPGIKLDALTSEEFAALSLDDQKQILMDCLDANHFYVNYGDIDDADYGISEEDKALNRSFYDGGDK